MSQWVEYNAKCHQTLPRKISLWNQTLWTPPILFSHFIKLLQPHTGPLAFLLFYVLFSDVYGMLAGGICIMPLVANEQLPTTVGKGQQPGRAGDVRKTSTEHTLF